MGIFSYFQLLSYEAASDNQSSLRKMMVAVLAQFLGEVRRAATNLLGREFLEDGCHTAEIVVLVCG